MTVLNRRKVLGIAGAAGVLPLVAAAANAKDHDDDDNGETKKCTLEVHGPKGCFVLIKNKKYAADPKGKAYVINVNFAAAGEHEVCRLPFATHAKFKCPHTVAGVEHDTCAFRVEFVSVKAEGATSALRVKARCASGHGDKRKPEVKQADCCFICGDVEICCPPGHCIECDGFEVCCIDMTPDPRTP